MISKIQSFNNNVNFQSRIHMDWHTAQFLESSGKTESVTGEFKKQLLHLKNNKERDVIFLNRTLNYGEDRFEMDVVTKEGHRGTSVVDNYYQVPRKKIDLIEMYNEAKNNLSKDVFGKVGFEALNI